MVFLNWGCPVLPGVMLFLISLAVVWSMAWKGVALWRAGRNGHLAWFIALFIVNTLGILPIIYIFSFSRKRETISLYDSGEIINE